MTPPVVTALESDVAVFERTESEVRAYCRVFPAVFTHAKGARLYAEDGRAFVDFFCGASSLNYGHNDERIKARLLEYLAADGVTHALDMYTTAKREFLTHLRDVVLDPRGLEYKVQFCGPTGADAVEAALKLARKATGRRGIVAFTGGYHGVSAGCLSVSGSRRAGAAGAAVPEVLFVPYEDGPEGPFDSIGYLDRLLRDPWSGFEPPAAVIVEPLQMEGGVYAASAAWLGRLRELTRRHGILLICDEIQSGCGRTGTFFCFEQAEIVPDVVTVSKSISGYGLPLSLSLFREDLDVWSPGEHSGTFRGNQLAFVAAAAALEQWTDPLFLRRLESGGARLQSFGAELAGAVRGISVRGRGMTLGIDVGTTEQARDVQRTCFDGGLIVELSGRRDEVVKVMPPLTIEEDLLDYGLDVLRSAVLTTCGDERL